MKLKPKCFEGFPLAITNKGYVVPCCYCDAPKTMKDPEFKKLLMVSNINFYDDLEDIFLNQEWLDFYENLKQHKGPPACMATCGIKEGRTRHAIHYDDKGDVKEKRIM